MNIRYLFLQKTQITAKNIIELDIEELTKIFSSEIDIKTSRQLAKDILELTTKGKEIRTIFQCLKNLKK